MKKEYRSPHFQICMFHFTESIAISEFSTDGIEDSGEAEIPEL